MYQIARPMCLVVNIHPSSHPAIQPVHTPKESLSQAWRDSRWRWFGGSTQPSPMPQHSPSPPQSNSTAKPHRCWPGLSHRSHGLHGRSVPQWQSRPDATRICLPRKAGLRLLLATEGRETMMTTCYPGEWKERGIEMQSLQLWPGVAARS